MFSIGAHIPREKNLLETMKIIKDADGNSLQIFVSNPRSVNVGEYNKKFLGDPEDIQTFINENNFKLIIHSPYTINLASSTMINKRFINLEECYWIKIILKELEIAHILGAIGCVIHTGKSTKLPIKDALINMKKGTIFIMFGGVALLGTALYYYYKKSKEVVVVQVGNFEIVKSEE
jgi:endonuclease IV